MTNGICRVCGCVDDLICKGGCSWLDSDICDKCAYQKKISRSPPPNARWFRELRSIMGWTQAQLAELLGVHKLTVSRWERGVLKPTKFQLGLIMAVQQGMERDHGIAKLAPHFLITGGPVTALYAFLHAAFRQARKHHSNASPAREDRTGLGTSALIPGSKPPLLKRDP